LHWLAERPRPDAEAMLAMLTGKTAAEIQTAADAYKARFNSDLHADLVKNLGGLEAFAVNQALRGAPKSPEEAIARLDEVLEFLRGGWENAPGRALVDQVSDVGKRFEAEVKGVHERYQAALANGGEQSDPRVEAAINEAYTAAAKLIGIRNELSVVAQALGADVGIAAGTFAPPGFNIVTRALGGVAGSVGGAALIQGKAYTANDAARVAVLGTMNAVVGMRTKLNVAHMLLAHRILSGGANVAEHKGEGKSKLELFTQGYAEGGANQLVEAVDHGAAAVNKARK
jgi:hypothetical protein